MKAVVFQGPRDVSVEEVADPRIEAPPDAIVRITTANICGSDLHPYEGRAPLDAGIQPAQAARRDRARERLHHAV